MKDAYVFRDQAMDPNDSAWKTGAFLQCTQASILVITDFLIPTVIYALAYFRMLDMFPTNTGPVDLTCHENACKFLPALAVSSDELK